MGARARAADAAHGRELAFEQAGQRIDLRQRAGIRVAAEVHAVVVAEHGHEESVTGGQRAHRVALLDRRAQQRDRLARPRDRGHGQVEQPTRRREAGERSLDGRRDERGGVQCGLGHLRAPRALQSPGALVDEPESLIRRSRVDGQIDEGEGDAVGDAALVLRAAVHRDHGPQRHGRLPARERELAQRARHGGEADVVERDTGRPFDPQDVVDAGGMARQAACGPGGNVEVGGRGRRQGVLAHGRDHPGEARGAGGGAPPGIARRARRALGPAPGRPRLLAHGRDAELRGGGRLLRGPVVGLEDGPLSRVGEQGRGELHAADPVGHRVMNAAAEADATILETRHEREVPQRPGAVERLGEQGVDQVVEAVQRHRFVGPGVGDDVAGDVEARVVHPERVAQPRRRIGEPVPAARQLAQAGADRRPQRLHRRTLARGVRTAQPDPRDVHGRARRFEPQEGRIERRKLFQNAHPGRAHRPIVVNARSAWSSSPTPPPGRRPPAPTRGPRRRAPRSQRSRGAPPARRGRSR